jgi:predicted amidohydrolase YtcJ
VAGLKARHTRVIDAQGHTVMPWIIESHLHLFVGSVERETLLVNDINGFVNLAKAVNEHRKTLEKGAVVVANGANYTMIRPDGMITRHDLDRIVPDQPFILICFDHHTVWANTKALEVAGLMKGGKLPEGNEIVMAPDGLASGELKEAAAFAPVLALTPTGGREWLGMTTGEDPVPPATPENRATDIAYLKRGLKYCASLGITSMHNMDGNWYQLELLDHLQQKGELTALINVPFHQKNFFEIARVDEAVEMRAKYHNEKLSSGRIKVFMDGVLESMTALMLDDYPGHPGERGAPLFTAEQFNELAARADRHGLRITVHAIGDGAVRRTLDGYAFAARQNGARDSRHRIEHIEVIDPADIPRLKKLGVIASMQPVVGLGVPGATLEPCLSRIGSKLPYSYAWQTLKQSGARMAFSSDWPVSPLSPFIGLQACRTQRPLSPDSPPQRQDLHEALHAFTAGGAYAEFAEDRKGMLKENYLADVLVLDRDIETTADEMISNIKPLVTICDGEITHEA